ncbi:MAG: BamA/TamA family outer membrane protein [Gemmatimonadota bacterium]
MMFPAVASGQTAVPAVDSSDVEVCAAGPVTSIVIDSRSVYDPESTGIAPLSWLYSALNLIHVNTSPSFIRSELLFEEGDCYDPFLVSESFRLLDANGFMFVEEIREEPDGAGGHTIFVSTRDEWSTKVDVGVTYDAGANLERFQATEENFLGYGVFAEFTHYARRETRTQSFGIRSPRFFGRSDVGIAAGTTRPGRFFDQFWWYPFVGETGRWAVREGITSGTDFFSITPDGAEPFDQLLLPVFKEQIELSAAYRFGEPGASLILGATLTRDLLEFDRVPEVTFGDFDERQELSTPPPGEMTRQLRPYSATRAMVHLGMRRIRYVEYIGLDAVREPNLLGLGTFAGLTVGTSTGLLASDRAPTEHDYFVRTHGKALLPLGASLFYGTVSAEGRHPSEGWRDLFGEVELAAYGRAGWLPWQTLFFRASGSGGWDTTVPFQLSLGGREGVRSLREDRLPGGRMVRFTAEDRIAFPWPSNTADLGFTFFTDVGRVWPGDVPYGVDSGWQTALGFGLRLGLPYRTRHIWRADVAFPVGTAGGSPIFRVTFELNRLRDGFSVTDIDRSRQFNVGPDTFYTGGR